MEYNTIIWTYTSSEKTEFETQKKYIGKLLSIGADVPRHVEAQDIAENQNVQIANHV